MLTILGGTPRTLATARLIHHDWLRLHMLDARCFLQHIAPGGSHSACCSLGRAARRLPTLAPEAVAPWSAVAQLAREAGAREVDVVTTLLAVALSCEGVSPSVAADIGKIWSLGGSIWTRGAQRKLRAAIRERVFES